MSAPTSRPLASLTVESLVDLAQKPEVPDEAAMRHIRRSLEAAGHEVWYADTGADDLGRAFVVVTSSGRTPDLAYVISVWDTDGGQCRQSLVCDPLAELLVLRNVMGGPGDEVGFWLRPGNASTLVVAPTDHHGPHLDRTVACTAKSIATAALPDGQQVLVLKWFSFQAESYIPPGADWPRELAKFPSTLALYAYDGSRFHLVGMAPDVDSAKSSAYMTKERFVLQAQHHRLVRREPAFKLTDLEETYDAVQDGTYELMLYQWEGEVQGVFHPEGNDGFAAGLPPP